MAQAGFGCGNGPPGVEVMGPGGGADAGRPSEIGPRTPHGVFPRLLLLSAKFQFSLSVHR